MYVVIMCYIKYFKNFKNVAEKYKFHDYIETSMENV